MIESAKYISLLDTTALSCQTRMFLLYLIDCFQIHVIGGPGSLFDQVEGRMQDKVILSCRRVGSTAGSLVKFRLVQRLILSDNDKQQNLCRRHASLLESVMWAPCKAEAVDKRQDDADYETTAIGSVVMGFFCFFYVPKYNFGSFPKMSVSYPFLQFCRKRQCKKIQILCILSTNAPMTRLWPFPASVFSDAPTRATLLSVVLGERKRIEAGPCTTK